MQPKTEKIIVKPLDDNRLNCRYRQRNLVHKKESQ